MDLKINKIPDQHFLYGATARSGWTTRESGDQPASGLHQRTARPIDTDEDLLLRKDVYGNLHAPFGTDHTPPLKVRIVGGRHVTVLEKPPPTSRGDLSGRLHAPADEFDSATKLQMARPPPLPPIPSDFRPREQMMPPEQQVVSVRDYAYKLPPAGNSSLGSQHLPLPGITQDLQKQPVSEALFELMRLLPQDTYLPQQPVHINTNQYVALLSELERDLTRVSANTWQQVYIELTTFDRRLTGEIRFSDLSLVLSRNAVFLRPHLMRLIGALFVCGGEGGLASRVNYEKIVSFLSACVQYFTERRKRSHLLHVDGASAAVDALPRPPFTLAEDDQKPPPPSAPAPAPPPPPQVQQPTQAEINRQQERELETQMRERMQQQFLQSLQEQMQQAEAEQEQGQANFDQLATLRAREDVEFSHFLQVATEQVHRSGQTFDSEKLRLSFQRADRLMRGTLSVGQIVDTCQAAGIPLEPALIADVVRKLCTHRGGGQYDWQNFQMFVDKLQPQCTSLPVGLRRNDRVTQVREPLPTWPYADPGCLPRLTQPENRGNDYEPAKYFHSAFPNGNSAGNSAGNAAGNAANQGASDDSKVVTQRNLNELRRSLEGEFPKTRDVPQVGNGHGRGPIVSPRFSGNWMERFMQLSSAVYQFVDPQGFSRVPMIRHVTRQQADTHKLMLADLDIDDALRFARTVDGRIDTTLFLKRLCKNKMAP